MAVIYGFVPAVNKISSMIYRRKRQMNVKQARELFLENKDQAQKNLPKYARKVKKSCRAVKLNSLLIFLLAGAFTESTLPIITAV